MAGVKTGQGVHNGEFEAASAAAAAASAATRAAGRTRERLRNFIEHARDALPGFRSGSSSSGIMPDSLPGSTNNDPGSLENSPTSSNNSPGSTDNGLPGSHMMGAPAPSALPFPGSTDFLPAAAPISSNPYPSTPAPRPIVLGGPGSQSFPSDPGSSVGNPGIAPTPSSPLLPDASPPMSPAASNPAEQADPPIAQQKDNGVPDREPLSPGRQTHPPPSGRIPSVVPMQPKKLPVPGIVKKTPAFVPTFFRPGGPKKPILPDFNYDSDGGGFVSGKFHYDAPLYNRDLNVGYNYYRGKVTRDMKMPGSIPFGTNSGVIGVFAATGSLVRAIGTRDSPMGIVVSQDKPFGSLKPKGVFDST